MMMMMMRNEDGDVHQSTYLPTYLPTCEAAASSGEAIKTNSKGRSREVDERGGNSIEKAGRLD